VDAQAAPVFKSCPRPSTTFLPQGFLDRYNAGHVCNRSDDSGRYAYDCQPPICKWNLNVLAADLAAHVDNDKTEAIVEEVFDAHYAETYRGLMRKKLGLQFATEEDNAADDALFTTLFDTMQATAADFTNTFRTLRYVHKVNWRAV
jgi:uncharacterized protein YdiU (UPF0061 family)